MPDNKDFLSQFSGKPSHSSEPEPTRQEIKIQSNQKRKPDSFNSEVRTKIEKKRKPANVPLLVGLIGSALLVLIALYFIFLAPKIEMPDFVGKSKDDVAAWVKQQEIEVSGIIFDEEYNFENDEGIVLEQSIEAGKKVKKNVKVTFVSSKGADPDEVISLPDIESMEKDEIKAWISENKLTKTKVTTAYSDAVEENKVISYDLSTDSDNFTRSSNLKITVSKGPQPAGTVTVEDFVKKDANTVEAWCASKKIEFVKTEVFSDTVTSGIVISQSPEANKLLKEGEKLSVVVSKGKGIKVPDLTTMTRTDANAWLKDNNVTPTGLYSNSSNYIISQSIKANTMASSDEIAKMKVQTNLGNSFYLSDITEEKIVGMQYNRLVDLCNEIRPTGIDAFAGNWGSGNEQYSYEYEKGKIVSVKYASHSTGKEYGENDRLPLDIRFNVIVSKGKITTIDLTNADGPNGTYDIIKLFDILADKSVPFTNNCSSDDTVCYLKIYNPSTNTAETITGNSFDFYEGGYATLEGVD